MKGTILMMIMVMVRIDMMIMMPWPCWVGGGGQEEEEPGGEDDEEGGDVVEEDVAGPVTLEAHLESGHREDGAGVGHSCPGRRRRRYLRTDVRATFSEQM